VRTIELLKRILELRKEAGEDLEVIKGSAIGAENEWHELKPQIMWVHENEYDYCFDTWEEVQKYVDEDEPSGFRRMIVL